MTTVHQPEQIIAAGHLLPVVVLRDAAGAAPLADALIDAGLKAIEVTLRTPAAFDAIRAVAGKLLVGAGTVLTAAQVDQAVDAGATFVVTPGFGPAVVRRCQELGVPVFPGVATATEIQMALDAGLTTVKFFPAEQLGGAPMIKALSAPFPMVKFIPTGGIDADNLGDYQALPSVLAVGGTWMVAPRLVEDGNWAEVTRLTRRALGAFDA